MVTILDPNKTAASHHERVLLTTLAGMGRVDRDALRHVAAHYAASHASKERSHPKLPDPTAGEQFTSREKHLHAYAHGRGFCEGIEYALRALAGAQAVEQFQRYALPPKEGQ